MRNEGERLIPIFESCSMLDGKTDYDVKELIGNYWARRVHVCKHCKKLMDVTRVFDNQNPLIITVSVLLSDTLLNLNVTFQGSDYDIFAVAYTDTNHFIARIQRDDGVYEYDGMRLKGRLQRVHRRNPLSEKIITMSGSKYRAQLVWYVKI